MKKLQAMKAKKGFTLVELIVVIVIIAILAAILIPILVNHVRNSRCSAAVADCKSAHNIVAEAVTDSISQGWIPADGSYTGAKGSTMSGSSSGPTGVPNIDEVTVVYTAATSEIVATGTGKKANHMFPFDGSGTCTNKKCEQHV